MSEHYDFRYQPTGSGAISGQQVLEQTEDAINELGDYVNDNVGGAMDVAQQALETAQNAEQDAQTALDTANSFSSAIQSAQQDASTALSTAQTAQTTASNANNTAIQASQDASNAVTTANNASGQVSTLSSTVTALGQRVTTAEGNIGQNTSDITALTTRVGTAEGNITTLQNDVTIAQGNASSAMATAGQVKQQAFVFRYSSTALTASSTNSNALLDNVDNLKVGDKVIDSSGVLFSITAIDTQNSTFTIGTALIDLAQDSDVVHVTGNETVGGIKSFSDNTYITSLNFTSEVASQSSSSSAVFPIVTTVTYTDQSPSQTARLNFRITANGDKSLYPHENNQYSLGVASRRWTTLYGYLANLGGIYVGNEISANERTNLYLLANRDTDGQSGAYIGRFRQNRAQGAMSGGDVSFIGFDFLENSTRYTRCFTMGLTDWDSDGVPQTYYITAPNDKGVLGTSYQQWNKVYANEYYYGSDNTEFSSKFVTTDTNQTISGNKTFSDNISAKKIISNVAQLQINARSNADSVAVIAGADASEGGGLWIYGKNTSVGSDCRLQIYNTSQSRYERVDLVNSQFLPTPSGELDCGGTLNKWKSINGINPGALSLPDFSNAIDISSYITVTDGSTTNNSYTPPTDGYISVNLGRSSGAIGLVISNGKIEACIRENTFPDNHRECGGFIPVQKNDTVVITSCLASSIIWAYFIPCQGNV